MKLLKKLFAGCFPAGWWKGCLNLLPEVIVAVDKREGDLSRPAKEVFHLGLGDQQEEPLDRFPDEGLSAGGELVPYLPVLMPLGLRKPLASH